MTQEVSATVPKQQQDVFGDNRWMSTHERFLAESKDKEPDVLFLGDSIIAYLEQTEVFKEYFAPLHCLCAGFMGDTTSNLLWRIQKGELDTTKPKAVVLSIGSSNTDSCAKDVVEGIKAVVEAIRTKQPEATIFLLKLLPTGRTDNSRRALIAEINENLTAAVASAPQTHVLDIDPGFIGADGLIDNHDMFDYANLTQQGYKKAFEIVHMAVQSLLNPDQ